MTEIFENIRKIYHFQKPCPALQDHIEFFSESSATATRKFIHEPEFSIRMFPSWTPTFYINLGPAYRLLLNDRAYHIPSNHGIIILRDTIVERQALANDHLLTVKFYPGGLEAVLGVNQSFFINKIMDLSVLLPLTLLEKVKTAPAFTLQMELLQDFFLQEFDKKKKKDHYLKLVKDTILNFEEAGMKWNNDQLAAKLFTHSKTINRYFNTVIGTSPKHYLSLLRARESLTAWLNNKSIFDPSNYGYYDMSHFYKAIKQFTGA